MGPYLNIDAKVNICLFQDISYTIGGPYTKEMNCSNCNHMILEHHIVYGNDNEPSWKGEYCESNKNH